jgi:hypothetical protein
MLYVLAVDNRLTYSYDYTLEERDGVLYQVTKNQKAVVEPSKAHYYMSNLFNGDKLLGTVLCLNTYNIEIELVLATASGYQMYNTDRCNAACDTGLILFWSVFSKTVHCLITSSFRLETPASLQNDVLSFDSDNTQCSKYFCDK